MNTKVEPFPIPLTDDQQFQMWKALHEQFSSKSDLYELLSNPENAMPPKYKAELQLYISLTMRYAYTISIVSVITEDLEGGTLQFDKLIPKTGESLH